MLVERVADNAWLHADGAAADVDREDPVQVAARIDDDPAAHHLTGQRRARGPRDQADAIRGGEPNECADVGLGLGERHGQRPFLVLGRVGRVDRPRQIVDEQVAFEAGREGRQLRS